MADQKHDYPLWTVDTGDRLSEVRYRGHFETREEAEAELADVVEFCPDAVIRRCRRVSPVGLPFSVEDMVEHADLRAGEGECPVGAWANWDAEVVTVRDLEEAKRALDAWAERFLVVDAFICEGDEEGVDHG